ncbi:expressed unknown protein [Seminavis robusta]|uniref:Uncharacterized protein n=1 Tax=Seminavis robusta TaxID=568900 RepID=A0A9N8EJI1_9STRA|nr:expressed unknown protein [Seminavis robusta]|eukprot:Sro1347_g264880.1 n/a (125) ;mRNA; r:4990-5427
MVLEEDDESITTISTAASSTAAELELVVWLLDGEEAIAVQATEETMGEMEGLQGIMQAHTNTEMHTKGDVAHDRYHLNAAELKEFQKLLEELRGAFNRQEMFSWALSFCSPLSSEEKKSATILR